jgi:hypothetical protein
MTFLLYFLSILSHSSLSSLIHVNCFLLYNFSFYFQQRKILYLSLWLLTNLILVLSGHSEIVQMGLQWAV